MSFFKSKGFKYLKNLIIGVGAAVVLIGALFKIQSWPFASEMLTVGLLVEAALFLMLGLLGPDKDYYWEKLYPGLDNYNGDVQAISAGGSSMVSASSAAPAPALNGEIVERQLGDMVSELRLMSKSLSSLKALQEVDFSSTGDQVKKMGDFYSRINDAMVSMAESAEDAKVYKEQISALNKNLGSLNSVYGNVLGAMGGARN